MRSKMIIRNCLLKNPLGQSLWIEELVVEDGHESKIIDCSRENLVAVPCPALSLESRPSNSCLKTYVEKGKVYVKLADTVKNVGLMVKFSLDKIDDIKDLISGCKSTIFLDVGVPRHIFLKWFSETSKTLVTLLEEHRVLKPCTILVNPLWLTSWDIEFISEEGSSILLSPSLGVEYGVFPPLHELIRKGIVVGLAAWPSPSSWSREVFQAYVVLRYQYKIDVEEELAYTILRAPYIIHGFDVKPARGSLTALALFKREELNMLVKQPCLEPAATSVGKAREARIHPL